MIVLDQPRPNKQSQPPSYKIDSQTLSTFREWQGIYLAPSDKSLSHHSEYAGSIAQSQMGSRKPKTRIIMQALPACMIRQIQIKKNDTLNLMLTNLELDTSQRDFGTAAVREQHPPVL